MKKFLLLLMCLSTLGMASAQKVKTFKVNKKEHATYSGLAKGKNPMGQGTLTVKNFDRYKKSYVYEIKGNFNKQVVTSATVSFKNVDLTFKGEATYTTKRTDPVFPILNTLLTVLTFSNEFESDRNLYLTLKNGAFYQDDRVVAELNNGSITLTIPIGYSDKVVSTKQKIYVKYVCPEKILENAKRFADSYTYTTEGGREIEATITKEGLIFDKKQLAKSGLVRFDNNATCSVSSKGVSYKRANGDFILTDAKGNLSSYKLSYNGGKSTLYVDKIHHTFPNGNVYVGSATNIKKLTFEEALSFNQFNWSWDDFNKYITDGTLTQANGTKTNFIQGMDEVKYREWEKKYNEAKKTEYCTSDSYGYINTFKWVYKDLSYVVYDKSKTPCLVYHYPNGEQLLYSTSSNMSSRWHNNITSEKGAPNIYSWEAKGVRKFNYENMTFEVLSYELRITTPKAANGNYVVYSASNSDKELWIKEMKYTFTNHATIKSIDQTQNKVVLKDGSYFEGSFKLIYDPKIEHELSKNVNVKGFELKLNDAPNNITGIDYKEGSMYNAAGKKIAIYEYGRKIDDDDFKERMARIEAERLAELEAERQEKLLAQKVAKLKKKYPARFVEALAEDRFMEEMPLGLFKEFYGSNALKMTNAGYSMGLYWYNFNLVINGDVVAELSFLANELTSWYWY